MTKPYRKRCRNTQLISVNTTGIVKTELPFKYYLLDITTGEFVAGSYTEWKLQQYLIQRYKDIHKYEIITKDK